jgi:hypothetical protein
MIEVDWRVPFIDFIRDQKLPQASTSKAPRPHALSRRAKGMLWLAAGSISMDRQQASSRSVFPLRKAKESYKRYMMELMVITQRQGH